MSHGIITNKPTNKWVKWLKDYSPFFLKDDLITSLNKGDKLIITICSKQIPTTEEFKKLSKHVHIIFSGESISNNLDTDKTISVSIQLDGKGRVKYYEIVMDYHPLQRRPHNLRVAHNLI